MDHRGEVERLEKLFSTTVVDTSEIIRSYYDIVKEGSSSSLNAIIPFLNEKAVQLLSPKVIDVLKENRLEAYGYLLVANNLLNMKDVEDELLNGQVLMNNTPPNTLRKLKIHLGLSEGSSTNPSTIQQNPITAQQPQEHEEATSDKDAIHPNEHEDCTSRLPIQIIGLCTDTKTVDGLILHKLPLKIESTFDGASSIVQRFSFGQPERSTSRSKTILLMGATGSGKTTWINAMVNYVLGVEWDDPFRFVLIDEEVRGASQANSQTQGVTAYDLHYQNGFRIPFSLTIVDTPGFGDTGGIGRDKEITMAVQKFFEHQNGIQELDAVGFVVQSALVRLTASQKYIFNSVLTIFGKDIGENVRFLVTFADGEPSPPVLEAVKEAKLPCLMDTNGLPCHQSFNNGAVYKSKSSANTKRFQYCWEDGIENFKSFFDQMADMPTKSLQLTKEVLDIKKYLEIQLDFMHRDINEQLMKMEELRKTKEIIALNKGKVDANQNFEVKVPVSKKVKVGVEGKKALNCTNCQVTCHYPCNPSLWSGFCPAFWRSENIVPTMEGAMNATESMIKGEPMRALSAVVDAVKNTASRLVSVNCNVCPGNCPDGDHKNEDAKWDFIQQEETITMDNVRQKYEEAMGRQLSAEGILNGLQNEVEQLKSDIIKTMAEITRCSNVLREKALRGDPLSTLEYIQMIIDDERKDEKPGYEERIKSLEDVLERARVTQGSVIGAESP